MEYPARLVRLAQARARHGTARVDALARRMLEGDVPADLAIEALEPLPRTEQDALVGRVLREGVDAVPDAPEALRALVDSVSRVPFWVDEARLVRASEAFLCSGLLGGLVLGASSLVGGYCSPAGNKPLVFSGRLEANAGRRLAETSKFVQAVSMPGGMGRHAEGFATTVRVRLMHASVRRKLRGSDLWREQQWGVPINQADMAATVLLFSMVLHDGLAKLGWEPTESEREDLLHLWRYVGFVMGVCDDLRCATLVEARALWDLVTTTQEPPDEDSRALAKALMDSTTRGAHTEAERRSAERARDVAYALSRHLVGDALADALGYPKTSTLLAVKVFQQVNRRVRWLWRAVPGAPFGSTEAGARYWDRVVRRSLGTMPATFALADVLLNGSSRPAPGWPSGSSRTVAPPYRAS